MGLERFGKWEVATIVRQRLFVVIHFFFYGRFILSRLVSFLFKEKFQRFNTFPLLFVLLSMFSNFFFFLIVFTA